MFSLKQIAVAGLAACATMAAVAPAEALVRGSWDPAMVAYSYIYYSDAEKTQYLGHANDSCSQSGSTVYVNHPYIPTPYYDQTPIFVCSELGPYLPDDWPY